MIFSKMYHEAPYSGFEIFTNTKGTLLVYMIHDAGQGKNNFILLETLNPVLDDNKFHHVVVTYDGSSNANGIKIYADGLPQKFRASTNNLSGEIKTKAPVNIGSRNQQCCFESAIIDDLAIWNRVLSTSEINSLSNEKTSKKNGYLIKRE